jgi:hypothetical protein
MTAATRGGGAVGPVGQFKATRAIATLVVCGGLLAGGCQTDREVTRPEPLPIDEELLTDALLTQDDVPPPYVLDEDGEPLGPELVPEHDCDDALKNLEPEDSASVTFTGSGLGTTLTNTISYFPGGGGSVSELYNDILEDCSQAVAEDAGLRFTTEPLDFGVLSDDTFPMVVTIESDNGTIEERNLIIMRAGDLVSTIRLDGPRPTDLVVLDEVTRVALGNLGVLDQAT